MIGQTRLDQRAFSSRERMSPCLVHGKDWLICRSIHEYILCVVVEDRIMAHERAERAYRPSRFTQRDEFDELARREREENLSRYISRARAGLPLFDAATVATAVTMATQPTPQPS